MLKNSKVVLFVTLECWSGRKLLDPTTFNQNSPPTMSPNGSCSKNSAQTKSKRKLFFEKNYLCVQISWALLFIHIPMTNNYYKTEL